MRENFAFVSDNTAGICPEAAAALAAANSGCLASYGADPLTAEAKRCVAALFETECEVFFVFSGTAANGLVLSALCQPHHAVICHEGSHIAYDECGAPEFFTGGSKLVLQSGPHGKLQPADLDLALRRGHGGRSQKIRVVALTQSTEMGTVYTPEEIRSLADFAHGQGMTVQVDGARFANAAATLRDRGFSPADITWRAGVDVLCFGGTKNGLLATEAVVFFNRDLAREFDRRVIRTGQLASKMRFASAQWTAVLRDGTWLRHAAHANRQANALGAGLREAGFTLLAAPEANGVFVEFTPRAAAALEARGWRFHRFVGEHGYRLMCSWATQDEEVAAFLADARAVAKSG